jgi:hypothetical protein
MEASPAGTDLAVRPHHQRIPIVRTVLTMIVLVAVLLGSWALLIGGVVLLYRLFT